MDYSAASLCADEARAYLSEFCGQIVVVGPLRRKQPLPSGTAVEIVATDPSNALLAAAWRLVTFGVFGPITQPDESRLCFDYHDLPVEVIVVHPRLFTWAAWQRTGSPEHVRLVSSLVEGYDPRGYYNEHDIYRRANADYVEPEARL